MGVGSLVTDFFFNVFSEKWSPKVESYVLVLVEGGAFLRFCPAEEGAHF